MQMQMQMQGLAPQNAAAVPRIPSWEEPSAAQGSMVQRNVPSSVQGIAPGQGIAQQPQASADYSRPAGAPIRRSSAQSLMKATDSPEPAPTMLVNVSMSGIPRPRTDLLVNPYAPAESTDPQNLSPARVLQKSSASAAQPPEGPRLVPVDRIVPQTEVKQRPVPVQAPRYVPVQVQELPPQRVVPIEQMGGPVEQVEAAPAIVTRRVPPEPAVEVHYTTMPAKALVQEADLVAAPEVAPVDSVAFLDCMQPTVPMLDLPSSSQDSAGVKFASALERAKASAAPVALQSDTLSKLNSREDKKVKRNSAVKFDNDNGMFPGDRIEFFYEGMWLAGVLRSIDEEMVSVNLDVDREAGLVTKGPLSMVRSAISPMPSPSKTFSQPASQQEAVAATAEMPMQQKVHTESYDSQESGHTDVQVKLMAFGERVELCYEGDWLEGTLQSMVGETVYVKLDVDSETDFVVKAPLQMIRWAPSLG